MSDPSSSSSMEDAASNTGNHTAVLPPIPRYLETSGNGKGSKRTANSLSSAGDSSVSGASTVGLASTNPGPSSSSASGSGVSIAPDLLRETIMILSVLLFIVADGDPGPVVPASPVASSISNGPPALVAAPTSQVIPVVAAGSPPSITPAVDELLCNLNFKRPATSSNVAAVSQLTSAIIQGDAQHLLLSPSSFFAFASQPSLLITLLLIFFTPFQHFPSLLRQLPLRL